MTEIGSIEHIRAHIKKLNDRAKQRDGCGFFDDLCDELDIQSRQHIRDVATIVFTPEQIQEYIRSLLALTRVYPQIEPVLSASVQIIRQLQGECPKYSKSLNADQFYD